MGLLLSSPLFNGDPSSLGFDGARILIAAGLVAAALSYGFALLDLRRHGALTVLWRRRLVRAAHPLFFGSGLLAIAVALLSPLDTVADQRFSAHMAQHILLMMVAAPLLLLGLPSPIVRAGLNHPRLRTAVDRLTDPLLVFVLFNLNLFVWHVPQAYELALHNDLLHDAEHALFFYSAALLWWRVIDASHGWYPLWDWQPARWVYLLALAPPSYVLGTVLWGSGRVLYPTYNAQAGEWARTPLADQQFGGMMMWVQGWMFMMVSMLVFFIWYDPEREET